MSRRGQLVPGVALLAAASALGAGISLRDRLPESADCAPDLPAEFARLDIDSTPKHREEKTKTGMAAGALAKDAKGFVKDLIQLPKAEDQKEFEAYLDRNIVYESMKDVGASNQGVILQNEKLLRENQCFAILGHLFYKDIAQREKDRHVPRPKLTDKAGEGAFSEYKKGWLWELAQKYSGGNPALSLALIGVCGHDDINQGSAIGSPFLGGEVDFTAPAMAPYRGALQRAAEKCPPSREKKVLDGLLDGSARMRAIVKCPVRNSAFFAPESIPGLNVSQTTQSRVAEIIGDDILYDKAEPPAKMYHQMGSAALVCDLIQRGMTPDAAEKMQTLFAVAYRATRLCTTRASDEEHFSAIEKLALRNGSDDELLKEVLARRGSDEKFAAHLRVIGISDRITGKELKEKLQALRAYLVASRVFRDRVPGPESRANFSTSYGDTLYKHLDEANSSLLGKAAFLAKKKMAELLFGRALPEKSCIVHAIQMHRDRSIADIRPANVSEATWAMAKKKLAYWDLEMDWTREAHARGAAFARSQCASNAPGTGSSCAVLDQLSAIFKPGTGTKGSCKAVRENRPVSSEDCTQSGVRHFEKQGCAAVQGDCRIDSSGTNWNCDFKAECSKERATPAGAGNSQKKAGAAL